MPSLFFTIKNYPGESGKEGEGRNDVPNPPEEGRAEGHVFFRDPHYLDLQKSLARGLSGAPVKVNKIKEGEDETGHDECKNGVFRLFRLEREAEDSR